MDVVVLGAGYAGLTLTRLLESRLPAAADITLVNDGADHVLVHELHRVIRRPGAADVISVPIADVLSRASFVNDRVVDVDPEAGEAALAGGDTASWDVGALCLGSETAFYGIDGLREHATPLKSLADAASIREGVGVLCETGGRVVVGGAGLSGIQAAGEIAALVREEGVDAADRPEVVLVEQREEVAPSFPARFSDAVREELTDRGVDVETGTTIERARADALETDAGTLRYDELVWTGGIEGDAAVDRERPTVRGDLRLTESTLALGDAATVVDADGERVPASAAAATREAKTAAENVGRLVEHALGADGGDADGFAPRLDQFRFDVPGWLVSVGDGSVAQVGPSVLRGRPAAVAKAATGAAYLASVGAADNAVDLVETELL
ncbi:NAD(P)/FAD-dependent oxidoreductase [Halobaculum sp. P14]|uniref:NAD(P)/FAD-dependent oxidoreductase n=1 Tax=Halobaculum sp. P14 TaxID=3421638 RepID=UPI003EC04CEE